MSEGGHAVEIVSSLLLMAGGSVWLLATFVTAATSLQAGVVAALLLLWCGGLGLAFVSIGLAGLASMKRR